jgi:hypothetical protein
VRWACNGRPEIAASTVLLLALVLLKPTTAQVIHLSDFRDYQVLQRDVGGTSKQVAVDGTWTGSSVDHIQVRVTSYTTGLDIVGWQTVAKAPAGGTFTGTIAVPQGGWYRLVAQACDRAGGRLCADSGSHRWGVGINVLCIGQSNMVGNGDIHDYTAVTTDLAGLFSNDLGWRKLADPYDSGGPGDAFDFDPWVGASMIPAFVNALAKSVPGIPIGVVPAAKGATALHGETKNCWVYRDAKDHGRADNLYGNSIRKTRAAGGVELILMHQGETDATNGTSAAEYVADLKSLLGHYREDLFPKIPLFICQLACSHSPINAKNRTDSSLQRIRNAQHDADDPPNIYLGASCIDVAVRQRDDHYLRQGYEMTGERLANAVAFHYGVSRYYRGPEIVSARYTDTSRKVIDVQLKHRGGSDITPPVGITGFIVAVAGKQIPVVSAERAGPASVGMKLGQAIDGAGVLKYLVGKEPDIAGAVRDNSPLRLPLEPTTVGVEIR